MSFRDELRRVKAKQAANSDVVSAHEHAATQHIISDIIGPNVQTELLTIIHNEAKSRFAEKGVIARLDAGRLWTIPLDIEYCDSSIVKDYILNALKAAFQTFMDEMQTTSVPVEMSKGKFEFRAPICIVLVDEYRPDDREYSRAPYTFWARLQVDFRPPISVF